PPIFVPRARNQPAMSHPVNQCPWSWEGEAPAEPRISTFPATQHFSSMPQRLKFVMLSEAKHLGSRTPRSFALLRMTPPLDIDPSSFDVRCSMLNVRCSLFLILAVPLPIP